MEPVKKEPKNLELHKETVRNLSEDQLENVRGAEDSPTTPPELCTQCTDVNAATCTRRIDA